ncbi:MAG TPA: hypothetical protein ENG48_04490 [Candidatus Atribacteria bacterium]|nr:hypothetical protein [Candidatus Atribacteria bacterium]
MCSPDNFEDIIVYISWHIACKVFEKVLNRFCDILYSCTCYKDMQTKTCYLLDEALNIKKNQRISNCRAKIECFLSTFSSYQKENYP